MQQVIKTTFRNGVFVPQTPVDLPDGMEIEIVVDEKKEKSASNVIEPTITDPEERRKVLEKLFQSMDENPIPPDAPRKFTREELHERR